MKQLVEYVLLSQRSLMVRISECISGGTRALYSALVKMDCKSCLLCLLLMGPLSILCIVNSCNTAGYIIKPWYLYLSLRHRISFYLLWPSSKLKSIYWFFLSLSVFLSLCLFSLFCFFLSFPPSCLLSFPSPLFLSHFLPSPG